MTKEKTPLKVWIVDDEPGMCLGTKRALRDHVIDMEDLNVSVNFEVNTMESGEAFLTNLKGDKPHILLLDGKLPGIDGIEVLEELAKQSTKILTIMITAYATLEKAVKATKLGAYDFLAKPFTPDELRYALKKASRDIILTERAKQLEAEKQQVRFEFISVLAHELKSPLNAIEGFADIMKGRVAGNDIEKYDHMINRMCARIGGMRKLITDLLDLTRIESGKKKRILEPINLNSSVENVIENNIGLAQKNNITVNVAPSNKCSINGDSGEIEMLLNNLITNAIKYNKPNGNVDIILKPSETTISIIVRDTGIGMSKEEQQNLFKEFSRIKNNKTKNIEGSGLGLSIIHKIIQLYNATVNVTSEVDVGSEFTIELPIQ
jgi:two-component system sensor histidine kinase/response regulator